MLVLLAVIMVEVGGGLSLAIGMALAAPGPVAAGAAAGEETVVSPPAAPLRMVDNGCQPEPPGTFLAHPVLRALRAASKPLSNDQLAAAMAVTKSEASRRWREVAHMLKIERRGRELAISLAARLN